MVSILFLWNNIWFNRQVIKRLIHNSSQQNDLSEEDVHLLAKILSMGLVDADPNYLHHLKGYRDLRGGWSSHLGGQDEGYKWTPNQRFSWEYLEISERLTLVLFSAADRTCSSRSSGLITTHVSFRLTTVKPDPPSALPACLLVFNA